MESVSLKEYLTRVRLAVAAGVDPDVWVRAEISELKVNGSGHCYLTLIEKEESGRMNVCAKASAIIWANAYRMMSVMFESVTHEKLQPGMTVLVRVSPNFHEAFGFSLLVTDIDPTFTLGDMARRRQDVIDRLKADGVWDMNRELPFPELPQRIAVISSETAAGFGDFINQLEQNQRHFKFYWRLFPAIMQGADAPISIMEALDSVFEVQERFDVVAIVRGGGASADMLAFDDYDLTSSCAQFPLPVLSGVGHERDTCVLDMVAYQRCKTPTAVGAFLVECMEQQYARLCNAEQLLQTDACQLLRQEQNRMAEYVYAITKSVPLALMEAKNTLMAVSSSLNVATSNRCHREQSKLENVISTLRNDVRLKSQTANQMIDMETTRIQNALTNLFFTRQNKLELLAQKVELLSPMTLLKKGYSLTLKNGKMVRSAEELKPGDVLETMLADGRVTSVVK